MYDWVLGWADSPYGSWALFVVAFAESSFFPIPPEPLFIALAVSVPARAFRFALITSTGSVLGGAFGYLIGHEFYDLIGEPLVRLYGYEGHYARIAELYDEYNALAVAAAALTPIPYKVATITAGVFDVNFGVFIATSAVMRSLRYFLIGALIRAFGARIRVFIDRYFELLAIVFLVLLVGGFVFLGWLTPE